MKCRISWNWQNRGIWALSAPWTGRIAFTTSCVIAVSTCCLQDKNTVNCINATSFSNTYFCNKYFRNRLLNCLIVTNKTRLKQKSDWKPKYSAGNRGCTESCCSPKGVFWAELCCCCAQAAAFASWNKYIFDFGQCFQSILWSTFWARSVKGHWILSVLGVA